MPDDRRAVDLPGPQRILVINVCRIGDTLLASPAIRALAVAYPRAEITVLGHAKRVGILENLPFIARQGAISKTIAWMRGWLPRSRYDLALVYGFDESLVAYALRVAARVVAFRQKDNELNRRLYAAVEVPPFQSAHSVLLALKLTDSIGVPHAGYRLAYRVTSAEGLWAERHIDTLGLRGCMPRVGLQVASFPTKAYRDWPLERFAELTARVRARWQDSHFLLFGGSDDVARIRSLARELRAAATAFAGRLSLRQTAALMSTTHLYIGVDTGPTHVMSCFDIPLVGLYHCYSPSRLIGPLEHPCFYPVDHPDAYPCPQTTPMAAISVDAVFSAVERSLTGQPHGA